MGGFFCAWIECLLKSVAAVLVATGVLIQLVPPSQRICFLQLWVLSDWAWLPVSTSGHRNDRPNDQGLLVDILFNHYTPAYTMNLFYAHLHTYNLLDMVHMDLKMDLMIIIMFC